jgi:hypothetical protein
VPFEKVIRYSAPDALIAEITESEIKAGAESIVLTVRRVPVVPQPPQSSEPDPKP